MTDVSRSGYYYKSQKDDEEVIDRLRALAEKNPTHGFRKMFGYLRREGYSWNHKKVYRVYKMLKMHKRRKMRRRLPTRDRKPLLQPANINSSWSMDFMSDSLACGRKVRTFNVLDDCSREILAIEIASSIPAERVVRTLDRLLEWRGRPTMIRVDNGPEFTGHCFTKWADDNMIAIQFIQPGKPMQNGFIERFNGTYRKEVLDAYLFTELDEIITVTEQWIKEYNEHRPHESLGNKTPAEWSKSAAVDLMENFSAHKPTRKFTTSPQHNSNNSNFEIVTFNTVQD